MAVLWDRVTLSDRSFGSAVDGSLRLDAGGAVFVPHGSGPGEPSEERRWPIPTLDPASPALWVYSHPGAAVIHIGDVDAPLALVVKGVSREDVERALEDWGMPRVLPRLARAASEARILKRWAVLFVLLGLAPSPEPLFKLTGTLMVVLGIVSLLSATRLVLLALNGIMFAGLAIRHGHYLHCFRLIQVDHPVTLELRELARVDDDLREETNRLTNRLRATLWCVALLTIGLVCGT